MLWTEGAAIPRQLHNIQIFQALDKVDRNRIAGLCSWRDYQPGETIAAAQERSREVMFLTTGRARTYIVSSTGVIVAFGDIPGGSMFGELAAIDGEPRPLDVEAMTTCTVGRLPQGVFMELINTKPGFAAAVLKQVAANIRRLTARVFEFSTLPVKNRIHSELLRIASHTPNRPETSNRILISPAPKHAAMAARISTHREAVTRELNYLIKTGILRKAGSDLEVCDINQLRKMVDDAMARGQ